MADEAPEAPKIRLDKTAEEREGAGAEPSVPPSIHDQRTVAAMPGAEDGVPAQGWANPFAAPSDAAPAPAPAPPVNPFAAPGAQGAQGAQGAYPPPSPYAPPAPPYPQSAAVPPPPMAPEGPGQVPYGYPGAPAPGPGYGYPGQAFPPYPGGPGGYGGWPGMQPMPNNGLGTASLVTGIISVVGFCAWPIALVMGVLAIVFGSIGRARVGRGEATNGGQALAGIICGSVGLLLAVGFIVVIVVASTR
ncbi:DUF4190 domain-containing protein [Streptomyces sp. NPDC058683]|uniref:DUF4190 domain-containing protein n=1 Tax=Streptomyces sp. NPDC058683 TaxID=3346597 RepID=UPI003652C09B